MTGRSTESLLSELARDVEPVRPLPPLGRVAGVVLGSWGAVVALHWSLGGAPDFSEVGAPDPLHRAILAGLTLAAVGGLAATLARAVPGRERIARLGLTGLAAGFLLAVVAVGSGFLMAGSNVGASPSQAFACLVRAALLGLLPALLGLGWLVRAWDARPAAGAAVASVGAAALGALAVHAGCMERDALHMLLGHVLGPVAAAGLLGLAVAPWLHRHYARR
jgi:hypothetical protein